MKSTIKSSFKNDVLDSKKIVLLDIWAPWCAPCRGMEPTIEAIDKEANSWLDIVKLDASVEMELVQELGISGLPTYLVFKNGKIISSIIGATTKTKLFDIIAKAK